MIFNNNESARASVVIELAAPLRPDGTYDRAAGTAYGPDDYAWSYGGRADFYAAHLGGMQRLPNGNTLIAESTTGTLFEVSPDGIERWTFSVPRTKIPRALRYAPDYPGLIRL
jgi:hypothetical protein